MRGAVLVLCLVLAGPAMADPAQRATEAARALEDATRAMQAATAARDQVTALSQTIQAYEDGLVALRDGLRAAQLREASLAQQFQAESGRVAQLLSVLSATARVDTALALVHPEGALETARAGIILGEISAPLARDVAELREALDDLRAVRRARQFGALALEQGLAAAQEARVALSQAIADRGPLPTRLVEDPVQLELLALNSATLDDFATELRSDPGLGGDSPALGFRQARGTLPLPVRATLLHGFEQPDAAGVPRPGLVLATSPQALVTNPWPATVRYAGPLAGQGNVIILEPAGEMLLVLVGLGEMLVNTGEILPAASPLGKMLGSDDTASSTGSRSETLYLELREDGKPIDPEPWFAFSGVR